MSKYEVEKETFEIPQTSVKAARYPWDQMDVGQSFKVPFETGDGASSKKAQKNKVFAAMRYRNTHGESRFIMRTYDDFVRVWRTK